MWEELSQTERNSSGNPRQTKPKNNNYVEPNLSGCDRVVLAFNVIQKFEED